jgi:hypothetical protein
MPLELTWATEASRVRPVTLLRLVSHGSARVHRAAAPGFPGLSRGGRQESRRAACAGHDRDPRRFDRFDTPPLIGSIKVGNFTVWSYPHAGAFLLLTAAGFSVAGARRGRGVRAARRSRDLNVADKAVA